MTTTTETPAGTIIGQFPASSVVDMIVEWTEVQAGDLVVWDGEFRLVESNLHAGYAGDRLIRLDGEPGPGTIPAGTYAAVRRYLTEEG